MDARGWGRRDGELIVCIVSVLQKKSSGDGVQNNVNIFNTIEPYT